jgi:ketosteroid isomerase-like protein
MSPANVDTAELMRRFNDAFLRHEPHALNGLIADDCVMESIQPAPDGTRYEGRDACLAFWQELAADTSSHFTLEEITSAGDRAVIRWRYHYGPGQAESMRGVNLMRVRDGQIVEALGYAKVPAASNPLTVE